MNLSSIFLFCFEIFVELDELQLEKKTWRQTTRWMKYEERLVSNGDWSRPQIPFLEVEGFQAMKDYLHEGRICSISIADSSYINNFGYKQIVKNIFIFFLIKYFREFKNLCCMGPSSFVTIYALRTRWSLCIQAGNFQLYRAPDIFWLQPITWSRLWSFYFSLQIPMTRHMKQFYCATRVSGYRGEYYTSTRSRSFVALRIAEN